MLVGVAIFIAPTILTLAGLDIPEDYDGRDILSVEDSDDEALVYEYYWEFNYPQTPATFSLRTDRFKYIQYHGVWDTEELFDLNADPGETRNLIEDPELLELKTDMRARLYASLTNEEGENAIPADFEVAASL